MKKYYLFLLLSLWSVPILAQLDTLHWMPPMHARVDWGPQFLSLSTPETVPFQVRIETAAGQLILATEISKDLPFIYDLGNTDNTAVMVPAADLHKVLTNKGLRVVGPKPFFAYFRTHSNNQNQASDLTCKGQAALGKTFRIGHLLQEAINTARANFIGILATEDSTKIRLSDFDTRTDFWINGADVSSTGEENFLLQKGQTLVISQYLNASATAQPPNGLMGALLESSQPIVVNVGSWCGSPLTSADKDSGIDQIVPVENVGKEYILNKGNGSTDLERPIVIAHEDNTAVYINGSTTPVAVLEAGDRIVLPTSAFTSANNLYIRATKRVYVYQMIGGAPSGGNALRTEGLIFVPPISCSIPNKIDNINEPNRIGTVLFNGGLMLTAMRDSLVQVFVDGVLVPLGAPQAVSGNPDFVTYRKLDLFSETRLARTLRVEAQGAVQVAMYGQNDAASFAAFYSGFSRTEEPTLVLTNIGDGVCPDTLVTTGRYDGVQWFYENELVKFGKDTFLVIQAPGRYTAQGYLGVCRQSDFAADTLDIEGFNSPVFPFTAKPPRCFGEANGSLQIGTPTGGFPPYSYSINNGQNFGNSAQFTGLRAGPYRLVVRDSVGCYNRPLAFTLTQPDSLAVVLAPVPPFSGIATVGQEVRLIGTPSRSVVATQWQPQRNPLCTNCLDYTLYPTATTDVVLRVTDSAGCTALDTLTVYVQPNIYYPNVIKPTSDNGNHAFTIFSREPLPIQRLEIYNRWGEHIFEARNIETNDLTTGWDGTQRGQRVLTGVYVFYAYVEVLPGRVLFVKGDITVL